MIIPNGWWFLRKRRGLGRPVLRRRIRPIFRSMSDLIAASARYRELLDSVKQTIAAGRLRAARAVNNILVETYWQIGHEKLTRRPDGALPFSPG